MTAQEFEGKRKLMGYSRKGLGVAMNTSHRNIENWELGKYPVPPLAARLIDLLGRHYELGRELIGPPRI